jgi:endonuclease YncB( thermonuclease family)
MIKVGLVWHFKKYNSDQELSEFEIEARNFRKGLWIDENPMSPWENRKLHRNGISTKDSFNIEENNR